VPAPGDVVILDNLSAHKSQASQTLLKAQGNWLLFLPPYSPDLNPIEMAFSKLKAHLRRLKARTLDDLWRAVGNICDLFDPIECWNLLQGCRLCPRLTARRSKVCERVGLSRSQVYDLIRRGAFPPFIKLSPGTSAMPERWLDEFIETKARKVCGSLCRPTR
jgi:predicted DNA-binding transcriptional regulator AlpA